MPIILRQHNGHGPPVRVRNWCENDCAIICDCYDGTEDAGWQPSGCGFSSPTGRSFVEAALEWNGRIEEMSDE